MDRKIPFAAAAVSVQRHLGDTGIIRKNLYLLHCGTGAYGRDANGLEHSFLAYPTSCKRPPERRLSRQYEISAILKLGEMKVSFSVSTEEINSVLDCQLLELPRKPRKRTSINAISGRRSRYLEFLFDPLDFREILLHLGWLVLLERVTTRLLVRQSAC